MLNNRFHLCYRVILTFLFFSIFCYLSHAGSPGRNLLIDDFDYDSEGVSAARANWVEQGQTDEVELGIGNYVGSIQMLANFSTINGGSTKLAYWNRSFESSPLDLSSYTTIELSIYSPDLSPVTKFYIYLRSGSQDWYRFSISPAEVSTSGFGAIVLDMKSAAVEDYGTLGDTPGWKDIQHIRIAATAASDEDTDAIFFLKDLKFKGRQHCVIKHNDDRL